MAARRIKSLRQNGGGKNRKHRDHRSDKARKKDWMKSKETRIRKLIKAESFEAEKKQELRKFEREFNTDPEFRKKVYIMVDNAKKI